MGGTKNRKAQARAYRMGLPWRSHAAPCPLFDFKAFASFYSLPTAICIKASRRIGKLKDLYICHIVKNFCRRQALHKSKSLPCFSSRDEVNILKSSTYQLPSTSCRDGLKFQFLHSDGIQHNCPSAYQYLHDQSVGTRDVWRASFRY